MTGDIYSIPIQGKTDKLPHLHLIAATAGQNHLVIPGFAADGHELASAIQGLVKFRGCFEHQCCVELDNARHVKFVGTKTGKLAKWLVGRRQILSTTEIKRHTLEGIMRPAGMREVVDCVLRWHQALPGDLPPNLLKDVLRVDADLKAGRYVVA